MWVAATIALVGGQLLVGLFVPSQLTFTSPLTLFWVVVIAASGCVLAAAVLLHIAVRDDLAELGLLSSFAFGVSILALVHGITTPGVLYGSNPAAMSSVLWAVPIAAPILAPLIRPRSWPARRVLERWDFVVGTHLGLVVLVAIILLNDPTALRAPTLRTWSSGVVAAIALGVCMALSVRHLRLGWIGKTSGPLAVAIGFASLGASNLVWFASGPFTVAFWLAHVLDIAGVFAITIVAGRSYHQRQSLRGLLGPLIAQTPIAALELGLDPLVHRFVAALERKDQITRDHVVRTAELAIDVGVELGLPAEALHNLGIGALLHDVGKLTIPDALINKPGRLTDEEFALMRTHAVAGEALVSGSRILREATPIIRGHHERVDGMGYPDQLAGNDIPLSARIVSACDAYDAMANTRQYRTGMGHDRACAILREHAGSQWDPDVVRALMTVQQRRPGDARPLDNVGRDASRENGPIAVPEFDDWCGCGDALPLPVRVLSSS